MKKCVPFILLALMVVTVSGCDFFRQLAGRPVSSDIEAKRQLIERVQAEAAERARVQDSIRTAQKLAEQQAAAEDSLRKELLIVPSTRLHLQNVAKRARYMIVLGSFADPANARRLSEKLTELGHEPVLIHYSTGSTWVCTCPSDNLVEVGKAFDSLKGQKFFPANAWILEDRR